MILYGQFPMDVLLKKWSPFAAIIQGRRPRELHALQLGDFQDGWSADGR